jgi:hypothetical protein
VTVITSIIGTTVKLDRPGDRAFRCCSNNELGKIGPGNGKHALTLICTGCGASRGGLGQAVAEMVTDMVSAIVNRYGALDAPIILRAGNTWQ